MRYQIVKKTVTVAFLSLIFLNQSKGMEVPSAIQNTETLPSNIFLGCENDDLVAFGLTSLFPKFSSEHLLYRLPDAKNHPHILDFASRPEVAKIFVDGVDGVKYWMESINKHSEYLKGSKKSPHINKYKLPQSMLWEIVHSSTNQFIGIVYAYVLADSYNYGKHLAPKGDLYEFYVDDIRKNTYVKIAYAFDPPYQDKKYGMEIAQCMTKLLFQQTNAKAILHLTAVGDTESAEIANQCGFMMKGKNKDDEEEFWVRHRPSQGSALKGNSLSIDLGPLVNEKKYQLEETVLDLIQKNNITINISDASSQRRASSKGHHVVCQSYIFKIVPRNREELYRWCAHGFHYEGFEGIYAKRETSCKLVINCLLRGSYGLDYFYQKRTDSSQRKVIQEILEKALQELDKTTPKTENSAVDTLEVFLEDLSRKLSEIPDGKILALFGTTKASYKCDDILSKLTRELSSLGDKNKKDALQEILNQARIDLSELPDDTASNELDLFMGEVSNSLSQAMGDEPLDRQRDPLEIYKRSSKLVKNYKDEIKFCTDGVLSNPQGYQYKENACQEAKILKPSEKRMAQCKSIIADLKIKFESLFGGDQLNTGQKILEKFSQKFKDSDGKSSDSGWYTLTKGLMDELSKELSKALNRTPLDSGINPLKIYLNQIPYFAERNQFTEHYSFRLFCYGVQQGSLPLVQYVIDYHNNIWDRMNLADELTFILDGHLYSLMTYLIKKDYVEIFDYLIQCKEFKDYAFGRVLKDLAGNTPLHTLAKQGSMAMIQRFLKEHDLVRLCLNSKNFWGEKGMNPVQIALKMRQPQGIINILAMASRRGI